MAEPISALITVGDMLVAGAEEVSAACWKCNHHWRVPVSVLPQETTLATLQSLVKCPTCGNDSVAVEPAWPRDEATLQ